MAILDIQDFISSDEYFFGFIYLFMTSSPFLFIIPIILLPSLNLCGTECLFRRDVSHITLTSLASMVYGNSQHNSCIELFCI
jgi:hypothetical protein